VGVGVRVRMVWYGMVWSYVCAWVVSSRVAGEWVGIEENRLVNRWLMVNQWSIIVVVVGCSGGGCKARQENRSG
jgi:hypothetical protein